MEKPRNTPAKAVSGLLGLWTFPDAIRTGAASVEAFLASFDEGGFRKLAGHLERMYRLKGLLAA